MYPMYPESNDYWSKVLSIKMDQSLTDKFDFKPQRLNLSILFGFD